MTAGILLLTNNPLVKERMGEDYAVCLVEGGYREVLIRVRDMIYLGHRLHTHPLMGSIKPNQTPYRTVALSQKVHELSMEDTEIISNSIAVAEKYTPPRSFPQRVLKDLQIVDYSLIWGAMASGRGSRKD